MDKEFSVHHKEGKDISQQEKQIDSYDNSNTCPTFYATTMHQKGERELIKHWNKPNINLYKINKEVPYPSPKNSTRLVFKITIEFKSEIIQTYLSDQKKCNEKFKI